MLVNKLLEHIKLQTEASYTKVRTLLFSFKLLKYDTQYCYLPVTFQRDKYKINNQIVISLYFLPGWFRRSSTSQARRWPMVLGRHHFVGHRMCRTKHARSLHQDIQIHELDSAEHQLKGSKTLLWLYRIKYNVFWQWCSTSCNCYTTSELD